MSEMGIRGIVLKWFQSSLNNRAQRVEITYRCNETNRIINSLSAERPIRYGVPQGSVLGPVLFLLYINDLESCIEYGRPTFFADDISIFISGKSINSVQGKVNETINKPTEWFSRNKLIINKGKTTAILFHKPQKIHFEFPLIKLDDSGINFSDQLKFLGVWLVNNLKWQTHTQDLAKKLSKICLGLTVVSRVTGLETVRILYYAYFQSMLSYGLILWDNSANTKLIFRLQKRAIRVMMEIPKSSSCKQYFKYLHILPLPCLYIYEILVDIKYNESFHN
jgi:hypothetical protein